MTHISYKKNNSPHNLFEGIATGTIIYVVFFEIFPKAKTVGGTGTQHILAMVLGFVIFIPSLYFRKHVAKIDRFTYFCFLDEMTEEESPKCPDSKDLEYCWSMLNIWFEIHLDIP